MGTICCPKASQTSHDIETEKEVSIPSYSSIPDKELNKLEITYNLLKEMSFSDFIFSLTQFNMSNATVADDYSTKPKSYSKNSEYFTESIPTDLFQSFIENKIFKHPNIYTKAGENEILAGISKAILLEIHKSLAVKLKQHAKESGLPKDDDVIKKYHIMCIGLLYCSGSNVSKIKILFDLFEENQKFNKSEALRNFLLSLFIVPAYCMISARTKVGQQFKEIGDLDKELMGKLLDACQLKDSINLVEITMEKVFPFDQGLYYEQFKELFARKEESCGWLLTPKGVRNLLEKNNV